MSGAGPAQRIVCIGNRFVDADAVGPAVFDWLRQRALGTGADSTLSLFSLPPVFFPDASCAPRVDVIDGGLRGLDLLPFFEGVERVVLVDAVRGWGRPGTIAMLHGDELQRLPESPYDHAGSLTYLLKVLPRLVVRLPEIVGVGVEPPANGETVERAALAAIAQCAAPRVPSMEAVA